MWRKHTSLVLHWVEMQAHKHVINECEAYAHVRGVLLDMAGLILITHSLLQTAEVLVSVLDEVVAAFDEGKNNNDTGEM